MSTPRFDLIDIIQTIRQRRRFVIAVTVIAAVVGAVGYFTKTKTYVAKTEFLVSNPLFADRNNLFRTSEMRFVDYVGGDDDIDRVSFIAESDTVKDKLIKNLNLAEAYKVDLTKPDGMFRLRNIVKRNMDVKRTEFKDVLLSYTDTDPVRAANVANESIRIIEETFRGYYNGMRANVYDAIKEKIKEQDSTINTLTDTLAALRDKYGIYDIISPSRQNLINGEMKKGGPGMGRGIEQVQNIEATKDQIVTDRAKNISLLNEFSTGTKAGQMPLVQVITSGKVPVEPKGPGLALTVVAATLLGLFFSCFLVLLTTYYRALISVER